MYNSPACWKGSKRVVKKNLRKLSSKAAKLDALKENIKMRVIGFGLEEYCITWSQNKKQRSADELAAHLEWIIVHEKRKDMSGPPHIILPEWRNDSRVGTISSEVIELDEKFENECNQIRGEVERLRKTRRKEACSRSYNLLRGQS